MKERKFIGLIALMTFLMTLFVTVGRAQAQVQMQAQTQTPVPTKVQTPVEAQAPVQEVVGKWMGVLTVQGTSLRLGFNITKGDSGYVSTLDSPDQGTMGYPVKATTFDGSKLLLELSDIAAVFEGAFHRDSIVGHFKQNGMSFPLTLIRSKGDVAPKEVAALHVLSDNVVSERKTIQLSEGVEVTARLCLPKEGEVRTIVVVVHGTGPYTYLTKRQGFNYYDVLADGFCEKGLGFFTYNRRGVDLGETPPWYDSIDREAYANYVPSTEAADIETMIGFLKEDPRFKNSKLLLYGISEGTIVASMVAERNRVPVDALLLHGYAHENMYDIIKWQHSGEGVMILANSFFDKNGDKMVDREEYASDDRKVAAYRAYLFQNLPFDSVDVVKDGVINVKDLRVKREPFQELLMSKIAEKDGDWIWNNYVRVTIPWFRDHFALEPNKTRLLRVDVPIFVFHGKEDANVPVESVYDLEARFRACGKDNLRTFVFDGHNHDLNFQNWVASKRCSEGFLKLFEVAAGF
ncbi:MAG: alpha/beta hydrolase [Bacteroidales bacterium]